MFTRDELDTIIAACDAADRIERIAKTLGMNAAPKQRAEFLLLQEKAARLAQELDKASADKAKAEKVKDKADAGA